MKTRKNIDVLFCAGFGPIVRLAPTGRDAPGFIDWSAYFRYIE